MDNMSYMLVMATTDTIVAKPTARHPHPIDAPEGLLPARLQGRIIRHREAGKRYGEDVVDRLLEFLNVGDDIAYKAFLEIRKPRGFGWRHFERALNEGLPADAPEAVQELFAQAELVPDWVDWDQLRRGAIAYWRPGPIVILALVSSIARGFASYAPMKPTIFTGRLIDENRVGRRMVETLRFIGGATAPDAMRRDRDGWKLTMRLRMIHQSVRYGCSHSEAWDWEDWGLPINGTDNMIPPAEFSAGLAEMLERAGVEWSDTEREDITSLWRYIAYVLGAPDELLQHAMSSAGAALRYNKAFYAMDHPPDDTNRLMLHSLMDYFAKHGIGYDPLPDLVTRVLTDEQRKGLIYGLMYAWSPEHIRYEMKIPRNAFRHTVKVVKPVMRLRQRFAKRSPEDDAQACARMLRDFSVVTDYGKDEAPLADPEEIAADIKSRADKLRAIFGRN